VNVGANNANNGGNTSGAGANVGSTGSLPVTGSDVGVLATVALVLLGGGLTLMLRARRLRHR